MEDQEPVFDYIAENYDKTRGNLDEMELKVLLNALKNCQNILEIGAGTGRIMKPLQDHGLDITGVDISKKMLQKASEKGLNHLVIGNATNLPFLDKSFDAVITVHVFHLVNDLDRVFTEASRVSRKYILTFVRERKQIDSKLPNRRSDMFDVAREVASRYGYSIEPGERERIHNRTEGELIRRFPPDEKIKVREYTRKTNPENFVERMRYSSRFVKMFSRIPEEDISKIFSFTKKEIKKLNIKPVETVIYEYLAIWYPDNMEKRILEHKGDNLRSESN
jgi:ubiquinone/menaquinone biosynthesis C-methylase UbiE